MEQHRDEHIACASCGSSFLFSAGEAAVFADRGLAAPKRCKECRRARKEQQGQLGGGGQRGPGAGNGGPPAPRGDFRDGPPRGRSPRYTGDVNEYRSPMQDNSYGQAPAWRSNGFAPPRPAAPGGRPPFRGAPPPWRGEGNFRAPAPGGFDGPAAPRGAPHGAPHRDDFPPQPRRDDFQGGPPNGRPGPGAQQPRRRPPQEMFSITCNSCGVHAEVPFRPAEGRDVFCQACYRARKPIAT